MIRQDYTLARSKLGSSFSSANLTAAASSSGIVIISRTSSSESSLSSSDSSESLSSSSSVSGFETGSVVVAEGSELLAVVEASAVALAGIFSVEGTGAGHGSVCNAR